MALLTVYVDHAAADTTGDGSSGDPWKYLYQATGAIATDAGTNQYKVWVKASETYGTDEVAEANVESDDAGHDGLGGEAGAVVYIDQPGTSNLPNVFEGYHTTIADGGIVKIDCQGVTDQLTHGIQTVVGAGTYTVFKNFYVTRASGHGFSCNNVADGYTVFKNCLAYLNGDAGFSGDNYLSFVCCQSEGNTDQGFDVDLQCLFIACVAHGNVIGFSVTGSSSLYGCLAYNNSSHDYSIATPTPGLIANCTSDCEDAASDYCINVSGAGGSMLAVVNCVLYDGDYGIASAGDSGELVISRHNIFDSSNTADVNANWLATSEGNGTGNRGDLVDPANTFGAGEVAARTYSPGASALSIGIDSFFTNSFWTQYAKGGGTNPPTEA